jgi:hypothetical protein
MASLLADLDMLGSSPGALLAGYNFNLINFLHTPHSNVHVRYMSSEVEPCVVWALRVSLPFLAKLIED